MSLLDRINQKIAQRVHQQHWQLEADAGFLAIARHGESHRLDSLTLTSAVLGFRDIYAAEMVVLTLHFTGGEQVDVFEDSPLWTTLLEWLTQHYPLQQPAQLSQVQLMAEGPGAAPRELLATV